MFISVDVDCECICVYKYALLRHNHGNGPSCMLTKMRCYCCSECNEETLAAISNSIESCWTWRTKAEHKKTVGMFHAWNRMEFIAWGSIESHISDNIVCAVSIDSTQSMSNHLQCYKTVFSKNEQKWLIKHEKPLFDVVYTGIWSPHHSIHISCV